MTRTELYINLTFLCFFATTLIFAAYKIQKIEETNHEQALLFAEVCQRLEAMKTHRTFSTVSQFPPVTTLGEEGTSEDIDKNFPTLESPAVNDDPSDPYRPGADEADQTQNESEVQISKAESFDWAGPNVCELPTIK